MSRSYKKVPGYVQHTKGMKKYANKVVRRYEDIPDGGSYKKLFQSYNISDYAWLYFNKFELQDMIDNYYEGKRYKFFTK